MTDVYVSDTTDGLPVTLSIDPTRPIEIVAHNRNGELTIRGVQRSDILVRTASDDDDGEPISIDYANNRLEVRTDRRGNGSGVAREARRAAREARRAAREATRAATDDIFRRREGQFGKGGILGSWQIDFDEHIKHELRDIIPFGRGGNVDLVIEIPATGVEARVEAHTTSGEIRIEEIHGAIDAATASGEIFLRRVSGDLTVQSASGEINVSEPTGTLRARSASGDLEVHHGSLEQYVLNTASGDINLITTLIGSGPYRIDAVSGDVHLLLEAPGHLFDRGFSVPMKTVSGDLDVSGDGVRKLNRRKGHFGPETDDVIELAIRTVSGDANVSLSRRPERTASPRPTGPDDATRPIPSAQSSNPVSPVPPTPPAPPAPPEPPAPVLAESDPVSTLVAEEPARPALSGDALSRLADEMAASTQDDDGLAVLAALERGEIDVDEAMRRLDGASANR